jgi:hypothetical protein
MQDLKIKAKIFRKYVKNNKENWNSHHENEQTLKKMFSTLSKMIETTRKTRNNYAETLRWINALWNSKKKKFARDQFVQLLKSMRRCALRNLNLNDVRRVVSLTIKNRLMRFVKEMSTSKKSINKNWIKITNEKYDSFRVKFASFLNSSLTTLTLSLSFVMRFTRSSSSVTRLRKKKNRKTILVVLFSSIVLSSIEEEKNQKSTSVDLSLGRTSSQSFPRRLSVRLSLAREFMNHSRQRSRREVDWRTITATVRYHRSDSKIWRKRGASKM